MRRLQTPRRRQPPPSLRQPPPSSLRLSFRPFPIPPGSGSHVRRCLLPCPRPSSPRPVASSMRLGGERARVGRQRRMRARRRPRPCSATSTWRFVLHDRRRAHDCRNPNHGFAADRVGQRHLVRRPEGNRLLRPLVDRSPGHVEPRPVVLVADGIDRGPKAGDLAGPLRRRLRRRRRRLRRCSRRPPSRRRCRSSWDLSGARPQSGPP